MDGHIKHKRAISGNSPDRINLKKANVISTYIHKKKSVISSSQINKENIKINKDGNQIVNKEKINIFAKLKENVKLCNKSVSKSRIKSSLR